MKQLLILLVVFVVGGAVARVVVASEVFDQAQRDYDFQLEKYREEYREFDLKRTQYRNLQTFATQDELVRVAKIMLERRADVWYAYLQALRVQLSETTGLPIADRDIFIQQIVDWEVLIATQKQHVEGTDTMDAVLIAAQELDTQGPTLTSFSYEIVGNLAWAHVQQAITHADELKTRLKEGVEVQILDPDVRKTRLYGFDEVDKSLALAQTTLNTVKAERLHFGDSYDVNNQYKKAMDELTPAHTQVRRAYQLLKELSTGVEL